jgi:hypothetical protein
VDVAANTLVPKKATEAPVVALAPIDSAEKALRLAVRASGKIDGSTSQRVPWARGSTLTDLKELWAFGTWSGSATRRPTECAVAVLLSALGDAETSAGASRDDAGNPEMWEFASARVVTASEKE